MSLILAIPDIHQDIDAAEAMLETGMRHSPDRVVLLGDLYDRCDDNPAESADTARWVEKLRERLGERLVTLFGNHDLPYAEAAMIHAESGPLPDSWRPLHFCSGFSVEKAGAIIGAVGDQWWKSWKLHHREDGVLYTHAGADAAQEASMDSAAVEAMSGLPRTTHPLFKSGAVRGGGKGQFPGILWRDFSEYADDAPCPQVFGHTPRERNIRLFDHGLCLDSCGKSVALIKDGADIRILSVDSNDVIVWKVRSDPKYAESSRRHGFTSVRPDRIRPVEILKGPNIEVRFEGA